ncbi:MAG: hypothetical protein HYZ53_13985 [Planctomycetes bacterium]|nr:hypothetical protein [Planctomycetota bacterium]
MRIEYEPKLLEQVVLASLRDAEEKGDRRFAEDLHAALEPIYRRPASDERERRFRLEYLRQFQRLGYERPVLAALHECATLDRRAERFILAAAASGRDEEGDCLPGPGGMAIRVRALPERFLRPNALLSFLRAELVRVEDLLDPAFEFVPSLRLADRPAEENLLRDRYRLFWTLSVEGRVAHAGRGEPAAARRLRLELDRLYASLPEAGRETLFRRFWNGARPTHTELVRLARDVAAVCAVAGVDPSEGARPILGSPCPLCRFPAHDWAHAPLPAAVVAAIHVDFPGWRAEQGACGRCAEMYEAQATGVAAH